MVAQLLRLGVEVVEFHVRIGDGSFVFRIVVAAGRPQVLPPAFQRRFWIWSQVP